MYKAQLAINELKGFYKRRKALILLCPIIITGLSIGAGYWLPAEYKSSITILVEKDETLNPMVRYNMAVAMASEDRLRSFNEMIYSRPTINMLIDSLDLADKNDMQRDDLITKVKNNISTRLKASDSFSITYFSKDPERAKRGVKLLSDHFIETKLELENKRNAQTVDFFQNKLEELQQTVEKRESQLMSEIQKDVETTPRENRSLQSDLDQVEDKLDEINVNIRATKKKLDTIQSVINGEEDIKTLLQLDLGAVSSGDRIQSLINEYQKVSDRYTNQFPKVKELRRKVYEAAEQLQSDIQASLFDQQAQKRFLENQQSEVTKKIQQTTIADRKTTQSKMNVDIYRELYDEMKVKLEQAKTTRDLGKNSENQFVVIEPPVVPNEPAKPNKLLLAGGGLCLGIFLGLLVAAIAELLDTTIRRPGDLKKFNKPVVAYISKGEV